MMALRSTHFACHYRFGVAFGLPQGPVADLGIITDMIWAEARGPTAPDVWCGMANRAGRS